MTEPIPRGRFAPSPTGPLHFGSLIAAVGSFLDIRSRGGQWLLRIEDLDPPREQAGAADDIMRTLESYALTWDETATYQSRRSELYDAAIERLRELGHVYYCCCSRKDVETAGLPGLEGHRYPGTCRTLGLPARSNSLRISVPDELVTVEDRLQGAIAQNLARDIGDFILYRRDGLYSYQLAVVVDDAEQGITDICRGTDLIDSTPRQVYLQRLLGYPRPAYMHLPVAINTEGQKLSKQAHAEPVNPADSRILAAAMNFLGHPVPSDLAGAAPAEILEWGVQSWSLSNIPRGQQLPSPL